MYTDGSILAGRNPKLLQMLLIPISVHVVKKWKNLRSTYFSVQQGVHIASGMNWCALCPRILYGTKPAGYNNCLYGA
jgi:hypothetical protein